MPSTPSGRKVAAAAGWALVTPAAVVAAARVARIERTTPLLMAEAVGPVIAAPALG
ncbi:MAG: hypothetical protein H0T70_00240, partial [Acidimicrobiia bacterium]|nr:hypothetical protein [Acidimicrobiia bacterium]